MPTVEADQVHAGIERQAACEDGALYWVGTTQPRAYTEGGQGLPFLVIFRVVRASREDGARALGRRHPEVGRTGVVDHSEVLKRRSEGDGAVILFAGSWRGRNPATQPARRNPQMYQSIAQPPGAQRGRSRTSNRSVHSQATMTKGTKNAQKRDRVREVWCTSASSKLTMGMSGLARALCLSKLSNK